MHKVANRTDLGGVIGAREFSNHWFLRTPGNNCNPGNCNASNVNSDGNVNPWGNNVNNSWELRPALLMRRETDLRADQSEQKSRNKGISPSGQKANVEQTTQVLPIVANKTAYRPDGNAFRGGNSSHSDKLPFKECLEQAVPLYTYQQLCDFETLWQANKMAHKGKTQKPEVAEFELVKGVNLHWLLSRLQTRQYRLGNYYNFTIFDPKERDIQALQYYDRVVMHALCDNILMPYFDNHLIFDNAACRPNKGTDFAIRRVRKFLTNFSNAQKSKRQAVKGYALKIDIRKYFESIDKEVLIQLLEPTFEKFDSELQSFVRYIIRSYQGKGLPMGNQTSQIFAIFYLDSIDRAIKERAKMKYYSRYMDDLIIIHESKALLVQLLDEIERFCKNKLKLDLNQKKTQIIPLDRGFTYLGWNFSLTETGKIIQRLTNQKKHRLKNKLRSKQQEYWDGKISFAEFAVSLKALKNHYSKGNTYKLRQKMRKYITLRKPKNNLKAKPTNQKKEESNNENT
jgi:hypothetical protein